MGISRGCAFGNGKPACASLLWAFCCWPNSTAVGPGSGPWGFWCQDGPMKRAMISQGRSVWGHSCGPRPAAIAIWWDKLIPCKLHGFARTNSGHPLWHHWCCSLLFTAVAVDVVELNVYQYVSWCNGLLVSSSYYDQNNFRQWQIYMLPLTVWERLTNVFCLIWMLSIIV